MVVIVLEESSNIDSLFSMGKVDYWEDLDMSYIPSFSCIPAVSRDIFFRGCKRLTSFCCNKWMGLCELGLRRSKIAPNVWNTVL